MYMEIQRIIISEEESKLVSDFCGEYIGLEIDFNRLMPVVEKIEATENKEGFCSYAVDIESLECTIKDYGKADSHESFISYQEGESKILCVYEAIIEFINFHNKNKE